jgi:predicted kinase
MDGDDGWETVPRRQQQRHTRPKQQQQQQQQPQRRGGGQGGAAAQYRTSHGGPPVAPPPVPSRQLTVIVLVGMPGCGKSTFCHALEQHLLSPMGGEDATAAAAGGGDPPRNIPVPAPVRVSQDELGSRGRCLSLGAAALRAGRSVVIDRCNFDRAQRAHWVKLAAQHRAVAVALFLHVPAAVCKRRVMARVGHPTLGPSAESLRVIDRFGKMLVPPVESEGFAFVVQARDQPPSSLPRAAAVLAAHLQAEQQAGAAAARGDAEEPPAAAAGGASARPELGPGPGPGPGWPLGRSVSARVLDELLAGRAGSSLTEPQRRAIIAAGGGGGGSAGGLGGGSSGMQPQWPESSDEVLATAAGEVRALERVRRAQSATGLGGGGWGGVAKGVGGGGGGGCYSVHGGQRAAAEEDGVLDLWAAAAASGSSASAPSAAPAEEGSHRHRHGNHARAREVAALQAQSAALRLELGLPPSPAAVAVQRRASAEDTRGLSASAAAWQPGGR